MIERPFSELQEELEASYQPQFDKAQSEEQHGKIMLSFVLERERLRNGISKPGPDRDRCDRETLKRLANPDALGPEHSMREAVYRRLARDPAEGARYWDAANQMKSDEQSARAKKPRPKRYDSITNYINELVKNDPAISVRLVREAFKRNEDFTVDNIEIRSFEDDAAAIKLSNLSSLLSRAKKRLSR